MKFVPKIRQDAVDLTLLEPTDRLWQLKDLVLFCLSVGLLRFCRTPIATIKKLAIKNVLAASSDKMQSFVVLPRQISLMLFL